MPSNSPKTPEEILSSLANQRSVQISKFETTMFHRHLESIGFSYSYDADLDITSWSNGQDSYITSHLGIVSFVAFEPGKDVLDTKDADSPRDIEEPDSGVLTEDELRLALKGMATGRNNTDRKTPNEERAWATLKEFPRSTWHESEQEPASKLGLKRGMFVRVPNPFEYGKPENIEGYRDFWLGKVNAVSPMANECQVFFEYYEADGRSHIIMTNYDLDDVSRTCVLPNTEVVLEDGERPKLLCPSSDPVWGEYCSYFVLIDNYVVTKPEHAVMAKFHMQDSDPLEQLRNYEFHNPSFKFPRDQLVECFAELHGATLGLDELVASRVHLMAHQAEVITRVLSDDACRYILADEVGLGKTIEACVILRAIKRNHDHLTTLIVVPESLTLQWHFELNGKFWLDFPIAASLSELFSCNPGDGFIVSTEMIQQVSDRERSRLVDMGWGLLIVDEGHHIPKLPGLYKTIKAISRQAKRALILSATPIQRQTVEFMALLKLMDPSRYEVISGEQFKQILNAQKPILDAVLDVRDYMSPEKFDAEEFIDIFRELEPYVEDQTIEQLLKEVEDSPSPVIQRHKALETLAYLSDNYRIETRILRNRRAALSIELATREFNKRYAYIPGMRETTLFNDVYEYLDKLVTGLDGNERKIGLEYVRIVLNALFSSPEALCTVLLFREQAIEAGINTPTDNDLNLLNPAAPRRELARIQKVASLFGSRNEEMEEIEQLLRASESLIFEIENTLENTRFDKPEHSHRFAQVIQAIKDLFLKHSAGKVILFSSWDSTLTALVPHLKRSFRFNSKIVEFRCGMDEQSLQESAEKFQSTDDHNILVCDELGGEGRNFQMADLIVHIDLPWTPAQVEQRIGRVDRLGRTGIVESVLPYAKDHVEADLLSIWEDGFSLFSKSMSGLEIALEDILSELVEALGDSIFDGLVGVSETMRRRAVNIREQVEKEAYYNDLAINRQRRQTFQRISSRYRDGQILGRAFKFWSDQIGLQNSYNPEEDILRYFPKQFNHNKMRNSHYVQPPNMEDALIRSGRTNTLVLKGTFNRDKAVLHEELIFFSPGSDRWTESILQNAFQSDRGRCCAIQRKSEEVAEPWSGFEFFYRVLIDPKPLFWSGFPPIHLSLAQEYLPLDSFHLLITEDGEVLPEGHPYYGVTRRSHNYYYDTHLGQRSGEESPIVAFKKKFPQDVWRQVVDSVVATADSYIKDMVFDEYGFDDERDVAREKFVRRLSGQRAAIRWKHRANGTDPGTELRDTDMIEQMYNALVAGVERPRIRLESATYWLLRPFEE